VGIHCGQPHKPAGFSNRSISGTVSGVRSSHFKIGFPGIAHCWDSRESGKEPTIDTNARITGKSHFPGIDLNNVNSTHRFDWECF
jgi:hypothetical protein